MVEANRFSIRRGDALPLVEEAAGVSGVMPSGATGLGRPYPVRRHRVLRTASARDALEPFAAGMDYEVISNGEFSLLDAILVLLERSGPAHLNISTWAVGIYDMEVLARWMETGTVLSVRFVLDVSFRNRQGYSVLLTETFGADNIRTTRTHAKFVTVTNEGGAAYSISSTANLNENKRLELFHFSDSPERCAFYLALVDELFREILPGWHADTGAPAMAHLDPDEVPVSTSAAPLQMGRIDLLGDARERFNNG